MPDVIHVSGERERPSEEEHQKQHWGTHRPACGAKAAASPSPTVTAAPPAPPSRAPPATGADGRKCARCLQPCGGGACRVPHPAHLRQDMGAMCGAEGFQQFYRCGACGG